MMPSAIAPSWRSEPPEQINHFATRQIWPQGHVARHVGETPVKLGGVVPGITTKQGRSSSIGPYEAEKDSNRRGFSSPVGTEEPMHFPLPDL